MAAWKWVSEELGTEPGRVAIHGRSLGGGVAVQLAAAAHPGALVLESTFTSMVDLAKEHFRWLPVGRVLEHRFITRDFANRLSCPLLVRCSSPTGRRIRSSTCAMARSSQGFFMRTSTSKSHASTTTTCSS
ncbi:MAG: hypothetical protein JRF55_05555 [Deltaproteobacteria bacterium]|nr:hypothetical protein [Deltaproteobacteria bacterium]